jgi:hypothetical protein
MGFIFGSDLRAILTDIAPRNTKIHKKQGFCQRRLWVSSKNTLVILQAVTITWQKQISSFKFEE